jgi:hypothetical protein
MDMTDWKVKIGEVIALPGSEDVACDQSPQVDVDLLEQTLEDCAGLLLNDLAYELTLAMPKCAPHLVKREEIIESTALIDECMAVAFEAGRRIAIHQAIELMHEDIVKPDPRQITIFEYLGEKK